VFRYLVWNSRKLFWLSEAENPLVNDPPKNCRAKMAIMIMPYTQ
jgi:hypothetical protein